VSEGFHARAFMRGLSCEGFPWRVNFHYILLYKKSFVITSTWRVFMNYFIGYYLYITIKVYLTKYILFLFQETFF